MPVSMAEYAIVIPARLSSSRFPRKLLYEFKGKPLILWTAERVAAEAPEFPLYFAVEDSFLKDLLAEHGYEPILTSREHPSGTDRIAEANTHIGADVVINIQGDEPLVTAGHIRMLAELAKGPADIATLAIPFHKEEDFQDPSKVKVVLNNRGHALYFSRSPIPFARDHQGFVDASWLVENACYRHMGMYAYSADFLDEFQHMSPGKLERIERLEQLRALENGYTIAVGITDEDTIGIDTLEDAAAFEASVLSDK